MKKLLIVSLFKTKEHQREFKKEYESDVKEMRKLEEKMRNTASEPTSPFKLRDPQGGSRGEVYE